MSTHRAEEELGLEPSLSTTQPPVIIKTETKSRSPSSLPPLDTSMQVSQGPSSSVPFTGISPSSGARPSQDFHRVASFESSGGYFSGAELSTSPRDGGVSPGLATIPTTPGVGEADRQSFETDELEGLAEDRVVAQGYLLCLKNVSGVRQWKRRWVVLRGRSLTLYKNFEVSFLSALTLMIRNISRFG
jgi:hypothetical protein